CHHAVHEGAVVQYGKIEPRSIPADKPRRVMLHRLEELLDQGSFGVAGLSEGTDAKPVVIPKDAPYDSDLLQVQGQEVVAHRFPTRSIGAFSHLAIGHLAPPTVECPQALNVRNRFKIEDQRWRHYRGGRYFAGSSGVPPRRISKCRRGDGAS